MSRDGTGDAGGADTRAPESVTVRPAAPDEVDTVRRLLDAAVLTVPDDLPARVADGEALLAVERGREGTDAGSDGRGGDGEESAERDGKWSAEKDEEESTERRLIGALVLDGSHVDAVAVNRSRRAEGVGSALVLAAVTRVDGSLTAAFRPAVRPFYESLGFDIGPEDPEDPDSNRLLGRLPP